MKYRKVKDLCGAFKYSENEQILKLARIFKPPSQPPS